MALEQTARDNYFRVVTWWEMPWGRAPRKVLVGQARHDSDKIEFECPRPPEDPSEMLNWGKPVDDQVWERVELPLFWGEKYLRERARKDFMIDKGGRKEPDYNWHMNPKNQTDEQFEFADLMWKRRLEGIWAWIGGEPVYLTGKYYTFLQWWWLKDTYPEYVERDLLVFYAWQAMCDDLLCRGGIFPKGRRGGFTSKFTFEGVEEVTRTLGGCFGIQAAGKTGASKVFNDKVKPGWKKWPPFFKPPTSSGDNPKTEIILDNESRRGSTQHTTETYESTEGWIKYSPNGDQGVDPFDGDKLIRFFRDEAGKADQVDIIDNWNLVSPTLIGRKSRGKAAFPSSVEDVKGKYRGMYKKLYEMSLPSIRLVSPNGSTESDLWALFLPIYCSHPEYWFIGKFGESIVHKPTPEQREWLLANRPANAKERKNLEDIYDKGGAYEYEMSQREAKKFDPGYIRKNPFTVEEAFIENNPNTDFPVMALDRCKRELREIQGNGKTLLENITIRGNVMDVGGDLKGDKFFMEDSNGRWLVNRAYLPVYVGQDGVAVVNKGATWGGETAMRLGLLANRVKRHPARQGYNESFGMVEPDIARSKVVIGFDPQKTDYEDGKKSGIKRLSKASAHGFIPYDPLVDGPWTSQMEADDPEFAKDWVSHAFVFEYIVNPKTPKQAEEDILRSAIFWSARIAYERQVNTMTQRMREIRCERFLLLDPKGIPGFYADQYLIDKYVKRLIAWAMFHCYPHRMPFIETMRQWLELDPGNMEKFDAGVSSGLAMIGYQHTEYRKDEIRNLPRPGSDTKKGNYADLHRSIFGRR